MQDANSPGGAAAPDQPPVTALPGLLTGDVAVVTGGAQGIGAAIARGLAASGAAVAVTDVNGSGTEAVVAGISRAGGRAIALTLDVADPGACLAVAEEAGQQLGPVSVLVNNAGIIRRLPPDAPDFLDAFRAQLEVNLLGAAAMARACLPQLRRTRGRIVNLASIASFTASRNGAGYAASKGGVAQLTRALAVEWAADGIRVNAIAPGVVATPMTEPTRGNPEAIGHFLGHTPLGRWGEPDELVGPVLFLASRLSSYVTGTVLPVDGGFLAT